MTTLELYDLLDEINRDYRQGRISWEQSESERAAVIWRFEEERAA